MPAVAPSRFLNDVYPQYPDDERVKEVFLMADGLEASEGDRHVLLEWRNTADSDPKLVTQLVQLTGNPGNYAFYSPWAKSRSAESRTLNKFFSLGTFTRAQRDQILRLADEVKFQKTSTVNGCRAWTRDLLYAMVNAGLLALEVFNQIDSAVPLKTRVPEV